MAVADTAASFAEPFGAATLARYFGLWHDAWKYDPAFQRYFEQCDAGKKPPRGPDHKVAGALLALKHCEPFAFAIRGHHGRLPCAPDLRSALETGQKRYEIVAACDALLKVIPAAMPHTPPTTPTYVGRDKLVDELFVRIVFSALMDAAFLDTERHFAPASGEARETAVGLGDLWSRLEASQTALSRRGSDTVSRVRHEIYQACLRSAELTPGLFRLTVPTGGGKTRSGMAFALRHPLLHDLRRVIVAVPYISITEQTAATYREIFEVGADSPTVLEHHSGVDLGDDEPDEYDPAATWRRLASQNWGAPIVVTTTVQLFESFFARSTSRTRKLHNLARSVIIVDEAQSLPTALLRPILDVLRQLCANYGATVVLSTATQPAFESIPEFREVGATEVVSQPERHFAALKRVRYDIRTDRAWSCAEVADEMRSRPSALAVLNRKSDALAPLDALNDPGALHLSTLLCGAHRRTVNRGGAAEVDGRGALPSRLHPGRRGRGRYRLPARAAGDGAARQHHPGGRPLQPQRSSAGARTRHSL